MESFSVDCLAAVTGWAPDHTVGWYVQDGGLGLVSGSCLDVVDVW